MATRDRTADMTSAAAARHMKNPQGGGAKAGAEYFAPPYGLAGWLAQGRDPWLGLAPSTNGQGVTTYCNAKSVSVTNVVLASMMAPNCKSGDPNVNYTQRIIMQCRC